MKCKYELAMDGKMFTGIKTDGENQHKNINNYYLYLFFIPLISVYWFYVADIFAPIGQLWYYSGSHHYSYIVLVLCVFWLVFNVYTGYSTNNLIIAPSFDSLLGITLCVLMLFIAYVGQLIFIMQLTMVLMLWFLINAYFGKDVARSTLNPFLLFLGAVPIFKLISSSEQIWIKYFLMFSLDILGILTDIMSNRIETKNIFVLINSTYTGLRYINAIFVISFVMSHLIYNKSGLRVIFILVSIAATFLLNLFRVLGLVLYAHYYGIEALQNNLLIFGWLFFILILIVVYLISGALKRFDCKKLNNYQSYHRNQFDEVNLNLRLIFNSVIILLLLFAFGASKEFYRQVVHSMPETNLLAPPLMLSTWQVCQYNQFSDWYPQIGRPDAKLMMSYKKEYIKKHIDLYMGYYEHQYLGNSLTMNNTNKFINDERWNNKNSGTQEIKVKMSEEVNDIERVTFSPMTVNREILYNEKSKRLVWHWYWINGRITSNKFHAKWFEFFDIIKSLKTHSALIAISAEFNTQEEYIEAEAALYDFLNDNYNNLYPKSKRVAVMV